MASLRIPGPLGRHPGFLWHTPGPLQRLAHFVSNSKWRDGDVRREVAAYALEALMAREPVVGWIFDDTGFLKQGSHSVGVQRQYTGSAGKIANCQIGVSLSVIAPTERLPIDFELYLPRLWTDDSARRPEARIPDEVRFQTKPELAIAMMRRAAAAGVPLVHDSDDGTRCATTLAPRRPRRRPTGAFGGRPVVKRSLTFKFCPFVPMEDRGALAVRL